MERLTEKKLGDLEACVVDLEEKNPSSKPFSLAALSSFPQLCSLS